MTCIVGVKTKTGVMLGGDTMGSSGWDARTRIDAKVFNLTDEVACGFTASYRMGQILRFHVTAPPIHDDPYSWAVKEFVPAIRAAFTEHGYKKVSDSRESGGTFLLAVRDRLFAVEDDFQVAEPSHQFASCGCGADYALGALRVLHSPTASPRPLLTSALETAEEFSNGVRGPFTFVETKA